MAEHRAEPRRPLDRGGRLALAAQRYYFGATGGGVWKTTDGGATWRPVADDALRTSSVGALAVSESNPDIVFAGMGEVELRGNVIQGDGLYKSADAGKTWKHVGLADTQNIARIRIHPSNPDVVFVAALGHTYGPNAERGVFRKPDGGTDLEARPVPMRHGGRGGPRPRPAQSAASCLPPSWEVFRTPHSLSSGGPGSGLFKSTDGGDTWTELTRNPGLPQGPPREDRCQRVGRGFESPLRLVEAEDGGMFRSDDGGSSWTKANDERRFRQRAFYLLEDLRRPERPRPALRPEHGPLSIDRRPGRRGRPSACRTVTTTTCGSRRTTPRA